MPDWKQLVREHLAPLRLPPERELEIVEELAQDLEAVYDEAVATGSTEPEAYARALREIADWRVLECELSRVERPVAARWLDQSVEIGTQAEKRRRGGIRMESLLQDLRYGMRMLIKNSGFTVGVALSLALGIGLNVAIFSVVNALLLRPLPGIEQSDELVGIYNTRQGSGYFNVSYPDYFHYREQARSFSSLAAHWHTPFAMSSGGDPVKADGAIVSGNYFSTLGLRPAHGRFFLPEEDRTPDTHPVAVISYGLWQRHFNSDPVLIGKRVILNGHSFTVIGVTPAGFTGALTGLATEVWVPLMMQAVALPGASELTRGQNMLYLMVIGRLKPGISMKQAQAELSIQARQLEQQYPETNKERGIILASASGAHPAFRGVISAFLAVLMAVVGIVLLIACANVANLLLARAAARQKEIAVRLSLGASRRRLIRQLLTESMLLALGGGVVGLIVAVWAAGFLLSLMPPTGLPFTLNLSPDVRVLGFTLLLSLLTGIVFGIAPALQATNPNLVQALKDETAVGSYRRSRLRSVLVVAQVALSLMLLIAAGLLIGSLRNAQRIDPGFNPEKLLTISFDTTLLGYDEAKSERFYQELHRRVASLPGVQQASIARFIPLGPAGDSVPVGIGGRDLPPGQEGSHTGYNLVGPDYFPTMGIPLLRGRAFTMQDRLGAPNVVVINETTAQRYWPNVEPVGQPLRIRGQNFEVIGVAKDAKYRSVSEEPRPFLYFALLQREAAGIPAADLKLHVRATGNSPGIVAAIRSEVQALDPNLPLFDVQALTEGMRFSLIPMQLAGVLSGVSGFLALLLATVGIYGVVAYGVEQRTREIGIRVALGAQARDVLKLVVRQGMRLVFIGVTIGLAGSFALTRLVSNLLIGISTTDPVTFVLVTTLLAGVALLACYIPARRATKVDPMTALRHE